MTEEDIKRSQDLVERQVQQINIIMQAMKELQEIVVEHQKFIVENITGSKPK